MLACCAVCLCLCLCLRLCVPPGVQLPPGLMDEVKAAVATVEKEMGKKFGDKDNTLLFSVRSGAAVSACAGVGGRWGPWAWGGGLRWLWQRRAVVVVACGEHIL